MSGSLVSGSLGIVVVVDVVPVIASIQSAKVCSEKLLTRVCAHSTGIVVVVDGPIVVVVDGPIVVVVDTTGSSIQSTFFLNPPFDF